MDKLTPIIFHKEVIISPVVSLISSVCVYILVLYGSINYQPSQLNFKDSPSEQDCVEG